MRDAEEVLRVRFHHRVHFEDKRLVIRWAAGHLRGDRAPVPAALSKISIFPSPEKSAM